MTTRANMTFAREGDVQLSFVTGTEGSVPVAGWLVIGCPKGTWTLGSSTASVDDGLDNWCTAVEAAIEGVSPGAKTIVFSGSMELILSDDAYAALKAAEAANSYGFFRIEVSDSAEVTTEETVIGGYVTQFDINYNGTGPSDVTTSFRANERHTIGS